MSRFWVYELRLLAGAEQCETTGEQIKSVRPFAGALGKN